MNLHAAFASIALASPGTYQCRRSAWPAGKIVRRAVGPAESALHAYVVVESDKGDKGDKVHAFEATAEDLVADDWTSDGPDEKAQTTPPRSFPVKESPPKQAQMIPPRER